jgi:hypothetical protein
MKDYQASTASSIQGQSWDNNTLFIKPEKSSGIIFSIENFTGTPK